MAQTNRKVGSKPVKFVDIARDAGVTSTVVSSLFNGNYYENREGAVVGIGKNTRKRILKSCRKLGYRPVDPQLFMEIYPDEADVHYLLDKNHHTFSHGYFHKILMGLASEAEKEEVNLLLGWFEDKIDYLLHPEAVPNAVRKNPTGKYILSGTPNYSLILYLLQNGAKICYTSRYLEIPGVVSLVPDHVRASELAVNHLIESGHRRIAVVADPRFEVSSYHTRGFAKGCENAFKQLEQKFSVDDILFFGPTTGNEGMVKEIFLAENAPTAIFCLDDFTALFLMQTVNKWGLRIPEDLSVVGCNDENEAGMLVPPLTTIKFPMEEIGKGAYRRIRQSAVEGPPEKPELEIWPVELIKRGSVRKIDPDQALKESAPKVSFSVTIQ